MQRLYQLKNRQEYSAKLRYIHPQINDRSGCRGHAFQGLTSLVCGEFDNFTQRIDWIRSGLPHPQDENKKITLNDLVQASRAEQLEEETNKILLEQIDKMQKKRIAENKKEQKVGSPPEEKEMTLIEKLNELFSTPEFKEQLKAHGVDNDLKIRPTAKSNSDSKSYEPTKVFTAGELGELFDYAWALRKAFIATSWEKHTETSRYEATRVIEQNGAKRRKISNYSKEKVHELQREKVLLELATFDRRYPYIMELLNLQIYISGLAVHQEPFKFQLFDNPSEINVDYEDEVPPLLSPVDLDFAPRAASKSSEASPGLIKLLPIKKDFTLNEIAKKFENLAKEIKKSETNASILPFGIALGWNGHAFTVGYNKEKNKFLLIDINHLPYQEIDENQIAIEVAKSFFCARQKITFGKYKVLLGEADDDQWVVLEDNLGDDPLDNADAKTVATIKDFMTPLSEIDYTDLRMHVYTSEKAKPQILPIFSNAWGDRSLRHSFFSDKTGDKKKEVVPSPQTFSAEPIDGDPSVTSSAQTMCLVM